MNLVLDLVKLYIIIMVYNKFSVSMNTILRCSHLPPSLLFGFRGLMLGLVFF